MSSPPKLRRRRPARRPFRDLQDQLSSIPVCNKRARILEEEPDHILVAIDLKYGPVAKFFRDALRLRDYKKYWLEGLGLKVFRSIDGKRSVGDLIDELAEEYALTFFESRALVVQFLQNLMERGLVVVGVTADEEDGATDPA